MVAKMIHSSVTAFLRPIFRYVSPRESRLFLEN